MLVLVDSLTDWEATPLNLVTMRVCYTTVRPNLLVVMAVDRLISSPSVFRNIFENFKMQFSRPTDYKFTHPVARVHVCAHPN